VVQKKQRILHGIDRICEGIIVQQNHLLTQSENYLGTELAKEIGSLYEVGYLEKSLSFEI